MDVYWINCLLACTLAYIIGHWSAERKFKRMLMNMMAGKAGAALIGPSNDK